MNLVMIVAALLFATHSDNPGLVLAIGVFVAGAAAAAVPAAGRRAARAAPPGRAGGRRSRACGASAKLMLPGIVGSSMAQVSLLLDTQIATFLVTGSVTWLYYADRLMEFPLGVFSIALATVILPGLSAHHAAKIDGAVLADARLGAAAGGAAGVAGRGRHAVLRRADDGDDLRLRRASTPDDVQMTSYALMAYSWGLLGFSFVKVLVPGYFARQDTQHAGAHRADRARA